MKKLYIMRHAKSSWDDAALNDYERPLNKRGKNDAPLMGEVLKKLKILPDLIVSSGAKRAITTARIVADKLGYAENKIREEKKIYTESERGLLKIINRLDNKHDQVMFFGHNPVFTGLINWLSDYGLANLPTAAMVGISFDVTDWEAVSPGTGTAILYEYPKKYK